MAQKKNKNFKQDNTAVNKLVDGLTLFDDDLMSRVRNLRFDDDVKDRNIK